MSQTDVRTSGAHAPCENRVSDALEFELRFSELSAN